MDIHPLSATFLTSRGSCCGSGCVNCPYIPRHTMGSVQIDEKWTKWKKRFPEKTYSEYIKEMPGVPTE